MEDYESWGSPHTCSRLLRSICVLEAYPQFENMIPALKEELKLRFNDIPLNKKGNKVIGYKGVMYSPNGLVRFTSNYETLTTTLEPYEYCPPVKKKKKVSVTTNILRDKFRYLPLFYKYVACRNVGLRFVGNIFNEKHILHCRELIKKIDAENISADSKRMLKKDILKKMFKDVEWRWRCDGKDIDDVLMEEFIYTLFDTHHLKMSKFVNKNSVINQNYEDKDKEFAKKLPKDYYFGMVIPNEMLISDIKTGKIHNYLNPYREDEAPDNYHRLEMHFNTFDEFLTIFKSNMKSLAREDILFVLKKIGLDMPKEEESNGNDKP